VGDNQVEVIVAVTGKWAHEDIIGKPFHNGKKGTGSLFAFI